VTYVADFFVRYKDGHEVVIDTKGCPDSTAKIKRKMFWYHYPDVDYRWITYVQKYGGWLDWEEVDALRKADRKAREQKGGKHE
jgi:hypothetical protein